MIKRILAALVAAFISTSAVAQQIGAGEVMGNSTASQRPPRGETVTAILDRAFAAVNGTVLCRLAGTWNDCAAVTLGISGTTIGTLSLAGNTSGTVIIAPQAAAGTPTLVLPNASGTFAVNGASPIVLNATTGEVSCPTCLANTPAAMTKVDDTNVTLTLGGTPATSLLQSVSLTLGWTGTLAAGRLNANVVQSAVNDTNVTGSISAQALTLGWTGTLGLTRGGCGRSLTASNGGLVYSDADSCEILSGTATAGQIPRSGVSSAPSWSTATYPATTAAGEVLASASANVIAGTATPTLGANGGTGGQITLNGATSGSSVVRVAAAAGTSTFQLPVGNGTSGQVLQTDGSGNTSWTAVGGTGTVTTLTAGSGISFSSGATCTTTCTVSQGSTPTTQRFLSGSGTYTTPAGVLWIEVEMVGGGGGGSGGGSNGGTGGNTCWNTSGAACTTPVYQTSGGAGSAGAGAGGIGGSLAGSGTFLVAAIGGDGGPSAALAVGGAMGGASALGGAGRGGAAAGSNAGSDGKANTGGGGGGGAAATSGFQGGGAGAYGKFIITSPAATYTYAVGAGGTAGTAGASSAGGTGGSGGIWVKEFYGT